MCLSTLKMFCVLAAFLSVGTLACETTDQFIAFATATRTRTLRPTLTPLPINTDTPTALPTSRATATFTPTVRPPTARPATVKPAATAPPKPVVQQPTVSNMEFHVNPPTCAHSGMTFIKGIVYLNKDDPSQRYEGAIVALGPPDGSTIYGVVKSEGDGTYTHILGDPGQARPGNWGVWLVTPSMVRKSDIGGPIVTNNLGPNDPKACWAGSVDFWK